MTARTGLLMGVLAILPTATGCISPGYSGVKIAQDAGPTCEIPLEDRNEVYVLIVGGNNPLEMMALDKFREGVNAGGYAKVAAGPAVYAEWMMGEMRQRHTEDPNAVFVIAGLDSAASVAVKLREKAADENIPVRALVIVDAANKTQAPGGGRTLLVGTNPDIIGLPNVEPLVIAAPGKLGLPAETRTIEQTVQLLNEIAIGNSSPPPPAPATDWAYPFAADVLVTLEQHPESKWAFMFDQPSGMTRKMDDALPPQTPGAENRAQK